MTRSPTYSSRPCASHWSKDSSIFGKCTVSEDSSFEEEIQCSKGLFLCSAADAASTIDYSKAVDINEGVVDSPPSRGAHPTGLKSPSPLRTQTWTPCGKDRSQSPPQHDQNACKTPQRKLYGSYVVGGRGVVQSTAHTIKSNGAFKIQEAPSSCPPMIQMKKQRFANEVARSEPSLPPIAHEGLRRSIRRHTLPGVPLQNEGGQKYRYRRREPMSNSPRGEKLS